MFMKAANAAYVKALSSVSLPHIKSEDDINFKPAIIQTLHSLIPWHMPKHKYCNFSLLPHVINAPPATI